jgi:trk system potassium uptake protein TrkH
MRDRRAAEAPLPAASAAPLADAPPLAALPILAPQPGWLVARRIFACYLAAAIIFTLIFHFADVAAHGNEVNLDRAFFTAVNALTLTGFQQTMGIREMRAAGPIGPVLLFILTVAGALTSLIVGALAAVRVLKMPHTVSQIVYAALTCVLLTTLGGGAVLSMGGRSVFESLFQATSAFCNSGVWLGAAPGTASASAYFVLLPLIILGGFGLPVLIELTDRAFGGPPISRHSKMVILLAAGTYLFGFVALVLAQLPAAVGGGWGAWRSTLASCSVQAINARTAGLPFQSPAVFTAAGQWVLMLLMLIGAAPAGTAGGFKTTTLFQLGQGISHAIKGKPVSRVTGIAAVWLAAFFVALFIGILALVQLVPQIAPDQLVFLACSAIANVGLCHDPVSITGGGLFVLSGLMLFGRIGSLAVLWWLATTVEGTDLLIG